MENDIIPRNDVIPVEEGIEITIDPQKLVFVRHDDGSEVLCHGGFLTRSRAAYGLAAFSNAVTKRVDVYVVVQPITFPRNCVGTVRELQAKFKSMSNDEINALAKAQEKGG
jgi:hypothetical protein